METLKELPLDSQPDMTSNKLHPSTDGNKLLIHPEWNRISECDDQEIHLDIEIPIEKDGNFCTGKTVRGRQCKNKTNHTSGFCWRHRFQ